jgi:hypothetical protein
MITIKRNQPILEFFGVVGGVILAGFALSLILSVFLAIPFEWLWNAALVPAVHVEEVGYWQSVGLLLLAVIVGAAAKSVTISRKEKE